MTQQDVVLEQLTAADPARAHAPEASARAAIWARIQPELANPRRAPVRKRSTAFAVVLAVPAVAVAVVVATLVHPGESTKPSGSHSNPHRGAGAILPHSVRMLDVRAPDPDGGPAWGMRVLSTSRGLGCIQVGRVVSRKLGVIGRDGAFRNDGRFHALRVDDSATRGGCAPLDGAERLFLTVGVDYMPASGTQSCYVARFFHGGPPPAPECKASSERSLYYGLLGPRAKSITYKAGGELHTTRTTGPEGAYLIVVRAKMQGRSDSITPAVLPWSSPITSVQYRGGVVCRLPVRGRPRPRHACMPQGYVPAKSDGVHAQDVRAPVRAQLQRAHNNRPIIVVTFTARVPVTTVRSLYTVTLARGNPPRDFYGFTTQGDVRAGQTITKRLPIRKHGTYRVTVRYLSERGPMVGPVAAPLKGLLVGRATVHVPEK